MSSFLDGRSRRGLLLALAFLCAKEMWQIAAAVGWSPWVVAVTAVGLTALGLFALRRWSIVSGFAALAVLAALSRTHAMAAGGPMRHEFAVGVALLGWLCGLVWAGDAEVPAAEALAETGAVAALAATYLNAAGSKLASGLAWAESASLRSMLAAHLRVDDGSLMGAWGRMILENPRLAEGLSYATLAVQLGAVLMLVGRRTRLVWAALLLLFHLQVAYLSGIYYWGAIYLLVVFAVPWPRRLAPPVLGSA